MRSAASLSEEMTMNNLKIGLLIAAIVILSGSADAALSVDAGAGKSKETALSVRAQYCRYNLRNIHSNCDNKAFVSAGTD
jgi:hypothetical protein